jgi:hypothetical protein
LFRFANSETLRKNAMSKLIPCSAALVLVFGMTYAFAQQTLPAAPDPANLQISPATCVQPSAVPPPMKNNNDVKPHNKWVATVNEYKKCMEAYWLDLKSRAEAYNAVAVKVNDAYISAVKAYNAFYDEVKKNDKDDD